MGRSSPIVLKNRVYLTAVEGDALATLAFDAQTGKTVWRRDIVRARTSKIYVGNDSATPTPATDGESLYVFFPDLGLVSFDLDGKERWRLAARAVRQLLRPLVVSRRPRRHRRARLRPAQRVVRDRGRQEHRPRPLARRAPAGHDRGLLDAGGLRAGRRQAPADRDRGAPQRRLRPGDGREPVVDRQAGHLPGRLAGAVRRAS